ncbi:MAG: serine--tRNA ligase [Bradyrhizobiaceae bacterium]|nr:serine--tRNA ligase [Bradyrhizobiaceae bacterium]
MFDPKWIRENAEAFDRGLARRGLPPESPRILALDDKRRAVIAKAQVRQERRNAVSKEIGEAKKAKDEARASALMAEVAKLKDELPALEAEQAAAEKELSEALAWIPNTPADDVPDGKDEKDNKVRDGHTMGKQPSFAFATKQHFELGEALGLMDFEAAAKLSGSRFVVLKGALARMERAISQFFLDTHTTEFGYTEVAPPILVRDDVMFGTAQLPKFKEDQFGAFRDVPSIELMERAYTKVQQEYLRQQQEKGVPTSMLELLGAGTATLLADVKNLPSQDKFWLIPTAEVPLTNLVRESIVAEEELPLRLTACTPCFRAEAGAAGKDTRGMLRQHQFTKVELVSITTPDQSKDEHERMLSCAEEVLRRLGLHFRVMTLCTGDMGFASQKTYDIEVWLPGQGAYREISSCSNCGEFQARRMEARWRGKDGRVKGPVHTLNGSGVAVGRALIAVMENYQDENGAIAVPDVLQPYMGGMKKIEKKN